MLTETNSTSTRSVLFEQLTAALEDVDSEQRAEAVAAVAETLKCERARRVDPSLNERDTYYVIHDTDLKLLKSVATVAVSLVPLFKPFTALPTLIAVLFRYRHKRARIDAEQAAVLLQLRSSLGGLTVKQLSDGLALRASVDSARVLEVLDSLRNVLLASGERSDFVVESQGLWTACDV